MRALPPRSSITASANNRRAAGEQSQQMVPEADARSGVSSSGGLQRDAHARHAVAGQQGESSAQRAFQVTGSWMPSSSFTLKRPHPTPLLSWKVRWSSLNVKVLPLPHTLSEYATFETHILHEKGNDLLRASQPIPLLCRPHLLFPSSLTLSRLFAINTRKRYKTWGWSGPLHSELGLPRRPIAAAAIGLLCVGASGRAGRRQRQVRVEVLRWRGGVGRGFGVERCGGR